MCAMPSGVAGSPSWAMMNRTDLPSGEMNVLHAALEVGVVEDLRRQVERVVVLRLVEASPIARRVLLQRGHLILHALLGLLHRQHHVLHGLHGLDHRRHQRDQLRHQRVQPLHVAAPAPGCRRSSCRCRRGCRRSTGSTSTPGCRSSAVPSRSSCAAAGRSRRNSRCCPAASAMSTVMSFVFVDHVVRGGGHLLGQALTSASSCRWSSASRRPAQHVGHAGPAGTSGSSAGWCPAC